MWSLLCDFLCWAKPQGFLGQCETKARKKTQWGCRQTRKCAKPHLLSQKNNKSTHVWHCTKSNEVAARCYSDHWLSRSNTSPTRKRHMKETEKPCSWDSSLAVAWNAANVQLCSKSGMRREGGESKNGTTMCRCLRPLSQRLITAACHHNVLLSVSALFAWVEKKENVLDLNNYLLKQSATKMSLAVVCVCARRTFRIMLVMLKTA